MWPKLPRFTVHFSICILLNMPVSYYPICLLTVWKLLGSQKSAKLATSSKDFGDAIRNISILYSLRSTMSFTTICQFFVICIYWIQDVYDESSHTSPSNSMLSANTESRSGTPQIFGPKTPIRSQLNFNV